MMASIFFMCAPRFGRRRRPGGGVIGLRLEYISFLAVHAEIEAFGLFFLRHAQADQNVADFENDQRADERDEPGDCESDDLIDYLGAVSIDQAERDDIARDVP